MLQARERVEQMKEEKKKQIEQKFAQIDEKTEKVRASGWWAAALWAGLHPGGPQAGQTGGGWGVWLPGAPPLGRGEQACLAGAGGAEFGARSAGLSEEGCAHGHIWVGSAGQGGAAG